MKKIQWHKRLAVYCFILLTSPLLLRLASGAAILMGCESELFYQLNAWLSWLAPLAAYEAWLRGAAIAGLCQRYRGELYAGELS